MNQDQQTTSSAKDFCTNTLNKSSKVRMLCRVCYHITPEGETVEKILKSFKPEGAEISPHVVECFGPMLVIMKSAGLVNFEGEYNLTQRITLTEDGETAGMMYFERLIIKLLG